MLHGYHIFFSSLFSAFILSCTKESGCGYRLGCMAVLLNLLSGVACCMFNAEPGHSTYKWKDTKKRVESVEGCGVEVV